MKARWTLLFAILFLTIFTQGLMAVEAAPAGAGGCGQQIQAIPAPASPAAELQATPRPPVEALFTSVQPARTGQGLECAWFCFVALCPQETTCGPTPGGGCGCNPNGGGTV